MSKTNINILIIEDNEQKKNSAVSKLNEVVDSLISKLFINLEFFRVTSYKEFQELFNEKGTQFFDGYIIDMQFPLFPDGPIKPECGLNILMDLEFNLVGTPACVFSSDDFSKKLIRSKNYTNQFILYRELSELDGFGLFLENVLNYKNKKDNFLHKM